MLPPNNPERMQDIPHPFLTSVAEQRILSQQFVRPGLIKRTFFCYLQPTCVCLYAEAEILLEIEPYANIHGVTIQQIKSIAKNFHYRNMTFLFLLFQLEIFRFFFCNGRQFT